MDKKIKGLTVEIGGDTVKLQSALKDTEKSIKSVESNLKSVNQMLKFDPSNTDLLRQKQQLLGDAVKENEEKLKVLRKAQQDLVNSGVSETSSEYIALQQEIQKTETHTKNLQKQMSALPPEVQAMAAELEKAGKKMEEVGGTLTKKVTAPIVAVGTASVVAFNDLDQSLDLVVKKTGASGDALEEMKDIVKDIGSEVPASFDNIALSVGEVNTRFGLTGDDLEILSTQFVKFAELNNTDVVSSVDNVQKSLSAFGLTSDDASHLLDVMNSISQQTGISVDTLSSGLIRNAAAFQEMGLSIDQSVALMGQIEVSGADTDVVLNSLSKVLRNAASEGKDMNTALAELQDSILNGSDGMDGFNKTCELFGNKAGPQIYNAIKNGSLSFQDLANMAVNADGSVSETFDSTTSGAEQFELAMQNVKLAGAELGEEIMKTLGPILEDICGVIREVTQWFSGLTDGQKQTILAIAGVIAAIGPALVAFGKVATGINSIMKTAEMLKGFVDLSMLGPAGIIMLVIGALVVLYTKCEWFRDAVNAVVDAVVKFFKDSMDWVINFFTKTLPDTFNSVIQFIQDNWQGLLLLLVNPFVGAFKLVYDNSEEFRNFIDNLVNGVIDFFTQLPEKATKWGKDMIDNFINGITEKVGKLWNKVKDIGKGIADYLGFSVPEKGPLSDADKWMPDMIDLMSSGIESSKQKLLDAVRALSSDMSAPMLNSEISRTLTASNNIALDVSMIANLDGRQVADSVENRITKKIQSRNAFKGA